MSEKKLNTRVINKHDIEVNWLKAINFIPKKGEIIVYDIEKDSDGNILELPESRIIPYNYERFKIGDGIHNVNELPFIKDLKNLKDGEGNGALEQLHDSETWTGIDADGNEIDYETKASGKFSTIYGGKSYAEGGRSLAGGTKSVAKGLGSMAFGDTNYAGDYATAFGYQTRALGAYSHTEGKGTIAAGEAQTAIGNYNEENSDALFIVGNGDDNENRSNAFTVHSDGSATIQTSGTNDNNVVNYKGLKDYVSANGGASPWNNQNEMLFSTGMVRIKNIVDTDGTDDGGTIHIGNATTTTEGNSVTISQDSICFDGLAYSDSTSTLDRLGLHIIKDAKNIKITGDGITYNNQMIFWERIIAAVEAIENAIDVSEVGQ